VRASGDADVEMSRAMPGADALRADLPG
jgi:hypothetical protein